MCKTLHIDWTKCTGCGTCTDICSASAVGGFAEDASRIRILRDEPRAAFVPRVCLQCEQHPCVSACPVNAIQWKERPLLVTVLESACTGCGSCAAVCPFDGVTISHGKALICNLCGGDPACAKACFSGALQWGEGRMSSMLLEKNENRVAELRRRKGE